MRCASNESYGAGAFRVRRKINRQLPGLRKPGHVKLGDSSRGGDVRLGAGRLLASPHERPQGRKLRLGFVDVSLEH